MLVLTRKPNGERIQVGDIIITIIEYRNGSIRVGIEAPGNLQINRLAPEIKEDKNAIQVRNSSKVKVGGTTTYYSKKQEVSKKRTGKRK